MSCTGKSGKKMTRWKITKSDQLWMRLSRSEFSTTLTGKFNSPFNMFKGVCTPLFNSSTAITDEFHHVKSHITARTPASTAEWEITKCTAMPSLMAIRWVGQNSGPMFRRLWTKVNRIKFFCAGLSVVCNAVFWLTMSCCVPEIFAIKLWSRPKSREIFDVFGPPNFRGKRPPKFLNEFYESWSPSNTWQSLVRISQAISEIRWPKKI